MVKVLRRFNSISLSLYFIDFSIFLIVVGRGVVKRPYSSNLECLNTLIAFNHVKDQLYCFEMKGKDHLEVILLFPREHIHVFSRYQSDQGFACAVWHSKFPPPPQHQQQQFKCTIISVLLRPTHNTGRSGRYKYVICKVLHPPPPTHPSEQLIFVFSIPFAGLILFLASSSADQPYST